MIGLSNAKTRLPFTPAKQSLKRFSSHLPIMSALFNGRVDDPKLLANLT